VGALGAIAVALIAVLLPLLFHHRFKTLEKTIADNTKVIESFRDTFAKDLAQIAAIVTDNSKRIDIIMEKYKNLEVFVDDTRYDLALRIARSEGVIGLESPIRPGSAVKITELGCKYLEESGIKKLLAKYDSELTALAETRDISSPRKVERAARYAINTFEGWGKDADKINYYMLKDPDKRIFNIWDIAGIYFRDVLMKRYGMQFPDDDT